MIKIKKRGFLGLISLCIPEHRNALSLETVSILIKLIRELNEDQTIRVIGIGSELKNIFISGANIQEFSTFRYIEGKEMAILGHSLMNEIENSKKPIIAIIDGFALGGGFELALACHLRLASNNAKFGFPEVKLGIIPGYQGSQRIFDFLGRGLGTQFIITAQVLQSDEAYKLGLINYLVDAEFLEKKLDEIVEQISQNSSFAIGEALTSIRNRYSEKRELAFELEREKLAKCMDGPDFIEGTNAFLMKRKPNFNVK